MMILKINSVICVLSGLLNLGFSFGDVTEMLGWMASVCGWLIVGMFAWGLIKVDEEIS